MRSIERKKERNILERSLEERGKDKKEKKGQKRK